MTEPPPRPAPDGILAGDADRDAAAETLADAVAAGRLSLAEHRARLDALYAAATTGQIAAVTAGLPERPASRGALFQTFDPYRCVVIAGRGQRTGRWRIGRFCNVFVALGRLDLDLRAAQPSQDEITVTLWGFGAHVSILVPPAWRLEDQVLAMGRREAVADGGGDPGAPLLRLRGTCLAGAYRLARG